MTKILLALFLFTTNVPMVYAEVMNGHQVRKLYLKRDDIALVRTAVGIATIIQVPDHPTSVVVGDLNAFKVEYLDAAITIKPLNASAKSNLYIYTEARRFNVSLVTVAQGAADFIVYLEPERKVLAPQPKSQVERWRGFRTEKTNGSLKMKIRRLGVVADYLAVEFSLSSDKEMKFGPDWIWITQGGKSVPIQGLNLSAVKIHPGKEVLGGLMVRREDLLNHGPLVIEVRSSVPISIKLPGVNSWMK